MSAEARPASRYVWWTLQANLDDGARIMVWLMSTDYTHLSRESGPSVAVMAELPDGRVFSEQIESSRDRYAAGPAPGAVRIGSTVISAVPDGYRVVVDLGRFTLSAIVRPHVPRWNPGIVLPPDYRWDVLVPGGAIEATYALDGYGADARGTVYFDENSGSVPVEDLFDHSWWGRGRVGEVVFVAVTMVPRTEFGAAPRSLVHLAAPGGPLLLDPAAVTFTAHTVADPVTGWDIPGWVSYLHEDERGSVSVAFHSEEIVYRGTAADQRVGIGGMTSGLVGRDGAYYRFFGAVTLDVSAQDAPPVRSSEDATWELIHFPARGRSRA
jgi:hypothetical protein